MIPKINPIFFTILTASYNSGSTILKTIESIQSQSFTDYEHIIIDGDSADDTRSILEEHCPNYNAHFTSEPDYGIANALNKGLVMASGKYIIVIQADDRLYNPYTLSNAHAILFQQAPDIFSCPVIFEHPERGNLLRKPIKRLWWNRFKFIFPHQGTFVHRRVFQKIGGFRTCFRIGLDYDFFYRALNHSTSVLYGNFPVAVMGGEGIGTVKENIPLRLEEERRVQQLNEKAYFWRFAQKMFHLIYIAYKLRKLKI
jgi:glycosyltransferase involved in cell wall biosynthesis